MTKTNIAEVKAKLSEYVERAQRGERIVICRHNEPVAELRALDTVRVEPRPVGPLTGRPAFTVPQAFFEPLADEELALWEGSSTHFPQRASETTMRVAEGKTSLGVSRTARPRSRRRS